MYSHYGWGIRIGRENIPWCTGRLGTPGFGTIEARERTTVYLHAPRPLPRKDEEKGRERYRGQSSEVSTFGR
jgi:hypothetical protein